MEKIELVIFDMDGLIFDTEKLSYLSWLEAGKKLNINFDLNIFYRMLGTNHESCRNTLIAEYGETIDIDEYIKEKRRTNLEMLKNGAEKKEGLDDLLLYLSNKNIKKAVATSSNREVALELLKKANVLQYFDYVLCGDEVKKSKPNPEVFLNVAKKLEIDPRNCLVLEDSEAGTIAASRGKMRVIIIPDLKEPEKEIEVLAYKKVGNLKEVIDVIENLQ
ncbi:HAD family phosphatase [Clostridium sp. AL.422]|uniref:HAD family hydrolase n=1 Tax=Clostridium TaxID=1485 RepID=UPI00293DCAE0|nr:MULTISPECIES: HAD family phosphatase [unclassified Clostridium]MDV4152392.1 HAD family phosphatase [Clostridium sp. AL.422]